MRSVFVLLLGLCLAGAGFAQISAITENGREVILNENGTWKYAEENPRINKSIRVNPKNYEKSNQATTLVRSQYTNIGFWVDSEKWQVTRKDKGDGEVEFSLEFNYADIEGMIFTDEDEIPLLELRNSTIEEEGDFGLNERVVDEEYRIVNGVKALMIKMEGNIDEDKFVLLGYFYSNKTGSTGLILFGHKNLMDTYAFHCEELLNGLVELD